MKLYVVDTNIVFTTAMNTESLIGQYLMKRDNTQSLLYAPTYLTIEMRRHFDKLVRLSGLSPSATQEIIELAYKQITFIDDAQIPFPAYAEAAKLVRDVDPEDINFVALAIHLSCELWTGDRQLYRHLLSKGFTQVVSFEDVRAGL